MTSTLLLSSKNQGKIKELTALLFPHGIMLKTADDFSLPDVEETGQTFEENALLKAEAGCSATNLPTLADDSGLCVDALDGAPGVFSARFGGYETLLKEIASTPDSQRTAHFVCVLAYCQPNEKPVFFRGEVHGILRHAPKGEGGFGYDPIFQPNGEMTTYAEMTSTEKEKTSHRKKALDQFLQFIT